MNQHVAVSQPGRFAARAKSTVSGLTLAISLAISTGIGAHAQTTNGTSATDPSDHARQLAALKKACDIGALSKEECAQRMASLNPQPAISSAPQPAQMSSNDPNFNPNAPAPSVSSAYRDNQGRYSLTIPDGWTGTPTTDGSGTLNLARGPVWATVTLMTGAGSSASHPKDITRAILVDMEPKYSDTGILDENGFKYNGHPAYGAHATGVDSNGTHVVVTVVSVQVSGLNFLSVVSSAPTDQAKAVNDQIMQMVHSIHFAGE